MLGNYISLDEPHLLILLLRLDECDIEVGWFIDIIVKLRFYEVVGDVVNRVIEAGVLVIYEDEPVGAFLNEDVIGQQVVVGEHQLVFLVLLGELVDELHFLLAHPLFEKSENRLLLGQEDILAHFIMAEIEDVVNTINKSSFEE